MFIVGLTTVGIGFAAVASSATAAADPDPTAPSDTAAPISAEPPPPTDMISGAIAAAGQNPVAQLDSLLTSSPAPAAALGQSTLPNSPAADPLADISRMFPQYYRMPDSDTVSPYQLTENAPQGPFARVNAYKGVHALLHGALGRMPAAQLGDPLPGTAPAPGMVLPAGPEQFLPDPADPLPPTPPPG